MISSIDSKTGTLKQPAMKLREPCLTMAETAKFLGVGIKALVAARVDGRFPPPDLWMRAGSKMLRPLWRKSTINSILAKREGIFPRTEFQKEKT